MKDSTMKAMIEMLKKDVTGPISKIAKNSQEQNVVLASKLEPGLEKAGYKIKYQDEDLNGAWARVYLGEENAETLEAQGYSPFGREDALLHAVWGTVRQEDAAEIVNAKLEKQGIKVDDALRQKLESVHILEGPAVVDGHLATFVQ